MTQGEIIERIGQGDFVPDILLISFRVSIYEELVVQNGLEDKIRLSTFISLIEDDRILARTRIGNYQIKGN